MTTDDRIELPLCTQVEIVETYAAYLATPLCIYYSLPNRNPKENR